jgi:hypothetical protein
MANTHLSSLAEEVEFAELKSTWKVMGEKGLRVHVDLEDAFDELSALEAKRAGNGKLGRITHK